MQGTLKIVPAEADASTQAGLNRAARAQFAPQIEQGFDAKAAAIRAARRTGTVRAGAEDPSGHVQVLEMLPQRFKADKGSSIRWDSLTLNEIHTVTFPNGPGSDAVDPLPQFCEATPDVPAFFTARGPCGDASLFENHLNPQPQGSSTIWSALTVGSSGIIASIPGAPFPASFSFTFPTSGTFTYQCRIHDHMTGTITINGDGDNEGGGGGGGGED